MSGEWEAPKTIKALTVVYGNKTYPVISGKNNVDSIKSQDSTGTWFDSYDDANNVLNSYQASYIVEITYN